MDCPICLSNDASSQTQVRLDCGHAFDKKCLAQWLDRNITCPTCRAPVSNARDIRRVYRAQCKVEKTLAAHVLAIESKRTCKRAYDALSGTRGEYRESLRLKLDQATVNLENARDDVAAAQRSLKRANFQWS